MFFRLILEKHSLNEGARNMIVHCTGGSIYHRIPSYANHTLGLNMFSREDLHGDPTVSDRHSRGGRQFGKNIFEKVTASLSGRTGDGELWEENLVIERNVVTGISGGDNIIQVSAVSHMGENLIVKVSIQNLNAFVVGVKGLEYVLLERSHPGYYETPIEGNPLYWFPNTPLPPSRITVEYALLVPEQEYHNTLEHLYKIGGVQPKKIQELI